MIERYVGRFQEWKENSSNAKKYSESIYLLLLPIYLFAQFIPGTMAYSKFPAGFSYHVTLVMGILVVLKMLLFDTFEWKDAIMFILVGLLIYSSCMKVMTFHMFYYYLFIIGARNIDYRKIIRIFLIFIPTFLVVIAVLAKLRYIPGLVFGRYGDATVRYALGTIYPTDLAARVFYVAMFYAVLRRFKFNLAEHVGYLGLTILIYAITDTRLDTMLMILVYLVVLFRKPVFNFINWLGYQWINLLSLFAILVSILLAYFYKPNNPMFTLIDRVLSGRLVHQREAFTKYNVTVFGQYVTESGNGGANHNENYKYFFIDSSFMRVLMMNGLVCFILVVIAIWFMSKRFIQENAISLEICLLLVIISSIIDQHMIEISFNVLFLAFFANNAFFSEHKEGSHLSVS